MTRAARLPEALAWVLLLGLQIVALYAQSLSGDGAHHLLAGHQALRYGQNTLNLEHPPLVKLVVALPLLLEDEPLAPPLTVEEALAGTRRVYEEPRRLRRVTVRARALALAVFVVPFLLACRALGKRFGGPSAGLLLTLMVGLSGSVLPNLTILQTDTAVALAYLLALLAALAYAEAPSLRRALGLGLACGLGLAVKFSAVLLAPVVLVAVLWMPRQLPWRKRLAALAVVGLAALAVVELSYRCANRAYDPATGRETIRAYVDDRGTVTVEDRLLGAERALLALERVDPYLAQWCTGFLGVQAQNALGVYASFAFGEVRSAGRWWYFPAVLLVKTPLAILLAALWAVSRLRPAPLPRRWTLPALAAALYLGAAAASNYNLGVRHLLPVLPILYLPVALAVARRRLGMLVLAGVLAAESLALAPLWMSSTNTWWLGGRNPTRFALSAGNLEYRQNFVQLARETQARGIRDLHVLYPTLGEEVLRAYLPSARLAMPGQDLASGWYAVNVTVEQFVPALLAAPPDAVRGHADLRRAAQSWQALWQAVRQGEDHGYVAGTFHLYRLER